ncbi:MAG: hypothetical protein HQK53_14260 [Oligoflexia bacterium]|nr:hypothetical protein [Oligoflexia bacterium]
MRSDKGDDAVMITKNITIFFRCLFFTTSVYSIHAFPMADIDPNLNSPRLTIGRGYDSVSGETGGYCVKMLKPQKISVGVADVTAELKYIEDYKSLAESLDITASANLKLQILGSGVSLGANARYFSEQKIESNAVYMMIKITVRSPIETMIKTMIDEDAVAMMRGEGGLERFRRRCGDEYVVAIQNGGNFYALIRISTKSEEEKKIVSADLKLKCGRFDTAASLNSAIQNVVNGKRIDMFIHQQGGVIDDIPLSLDLVGLEKLFVHAKTFAKNIMDERSGNGGVPVLSMTEPYTKLSNYPVEVSALRVTLAKRIIEKLSDARFDALSIIDRAEYIVQNSNDYDITSEQISIVNRIRDQYVANLDIVAEMGDECFSDIKNCRLPTENDGYLLLAMPKFTRLEDKRCIRWLYNEGTGEVCGVKEYNSGNGPICGVASVSFGQGSVCGVKRYNEGRAEVCGVELYREKKNKECGLAESITSLEKSVSVDNFKRDYLENDFILENCRKEGYDWGQFNKIVADTSLCRFGGPALYWVNMTCINFNECRHPSNGVERYKLCANQEFGVAEYNTCQHESFGVIYNTCRHVNFGVHSYNTCKHEIFGSTGICLEYDDTIGQN